MIIERTSPKRPLARKYLSVAFGALVIIAAVLAGITAFSSSPLPVLNASYKCVPGALIPQLKQGQSGTLTTSFGGFTATFRSTMPASTPVNGLNVGMPFKGNLTMSHDGQIWRLPRPANANVSQINVMCVIAFQREQDPGVMVEGFTGEASSVSETANPQMSRFVTAAAV